MGRSQAWLLLILLAMGKGVAADEALRLSQSLAFRQPELTRPGTCVMYREGGSGWLLTEPQYWVKGQVVSAHARKHRLELCPLIAGKEIEQYNRSEFNRWARAQPCVTHASAQAEMESGFVRFQVLDWETPWARRAANAGRLFHGHYLDQPLHKGLELEIAEQLLIACP